MLYIAIVADMPMKGVDISAHNGGNIDFKELRELGVEVVIMKSNEGKNFVDPQYENFYNEVKEAEIPHCGFYHFMSERTSPKEQAEDFWEEIRDKDFDVKPILDIETNKMGRSAKEVSERCIDFLEEFERLSGEKAMIYSGGYFSKTFLTDIRLRNNYDLWLAHYNKQPSNPMETGFNTVGHQYSDKGNLSPAIKGNVDMNVFSEEMLRDDEIINNTQTEIDENYEIPENNTLIVESELTQEEWIRQLKEKSKKNKKKKGIFQNMLSLFGIN